MILETFYCLQQRTVSHNVFPFTSLIDIKNIGKYSLSLCFKYNNTRKILIMPSYTFLLIHSSTKIFIKLKQNVS